MPVGAVRVPGCVWVEHEASRCGSARCWVLRGHLVGVVLVAAWVLGCLTPSVVGVVAVSGSGVVVG